MPTHRQAVRRDSHAPRARNNAEAAVPRFLAWIPPHIYERLQQYALLTRQDKPVGWLLLLWPTWWGLWLAASGTPPIGTLLIFTLGVIVMRSAGCVINDWADRWLDAKVERTRQRPLASGKVASREALLVFALLLLVALGLVLLTNRKTLVLAAVALVLAVAYPFMKRRTYWPQVWLGAAFGMSIPMAYTAVTDTWPNTLAWLVFTANVLWSTAYDTLYAMVDRDDDIAAGARSTAILFGELDLVAVGVLHASFLLAMALVGQRAGMGVAYFIAWGVAALMCAWQLWYARERSRERCFAAFKSNHWVGMVVFLGMAVGYATRGAAG